MALAGGIGLASLHLLLKRLLQRDRAVHLLYGVRSRQDLVPLEALAARGLKLSVAAEDGSRGFRGTVCELFQSLWGEGPGSAAAPSFSYACGPPAMLQQAAVLLRGRGIPCQVSVEARMACGFGVCQGCVIKARGMGDPQEVVYRKVCVDGPVFDADSVMWEPPA